MSLLRNFKLDPSIQMRQTQASSRVRKRKFSSLLTRTSLNRWRMSKLPSLAALAIESRCQEDPWIHLPWVACVECRRIHKLSIKLKEKKLSRPLIWRITKKGNQKSMSIYNKKLILTKKRVNLLLSAKWALMTLQKFWGKTGKMIKLLIGAFWVMTTLTMRAKGLRTRTSGKKGKGRRKRLT